MDQSQPTDGAVQICGACGVAIKTCEECGGKMCVAGCKDRVEDGCTCEK